MAHQYRLNKNTIEAIANLAKEANEFAGVVDYAESLLTEEVEAHREVAESASERWQDSDRGQAVADWITALDELLGRVSDIGVQLGDLGTEEIEEKA